MLSIPRIHFDNIRRFELDNAFKKTPVRNASAGTGRVSKKELKIGDLVKVKIFRIIGAGGSFPKGLEAEIVDIQQYACIDQRQAPFIPRSLISDVFFNEIARALKNGGTFTTWARIKKYREDHGNYILSLKESPDAYVAQKRPVKADPQFAQKPQIETKSQAPTKPEEISPAQMELARKDLIEGKFVKVKLVDVHFEQLKKDTPNVRATFTCEFCAEKVSASIKFNPHLIRQRGLKLLARYQETAMVRRQPPKVKKFGTASDQQIPLKFDEEDLLLKSKTLFDKEQVLKNSQRNQSV